MDERTVCFLRIEQAAALLRVDVADLAVELGRGSLSTRLVDGVPHIDGDAIWRQLDPRAPHMPRHLIDAVWETARAGATTVVECPTTPRETWSPEPRKSLARCSPEWAAAGCTPRG